MVARSQYRLTIRQITLDTAPDSNNLQPPYCRGKSSYLLQLIQGILRLHIGAANIGIGGCTCAATNNYVAPGNLAEIDVFNFFDVVTPTDGKIL